MLNVNNLKHCRSFDESMIEIFIEDPEYAEELLNDVLVDGDDYEIQRVQYWYDEARARSFYMNTDKLLEAVPA